MSVKNIVTNEERLSLMSLPVEDYKEVLELASDLVDTAHHYSLKPIGCVGLACNQIGIRKRIITIKFGGEWLVMINPEITHSAGGKVLGREGCLSRPGKSVRLRRDKKVTVNYIDIDGLKVERKFTKFNARVVQHEIDHLDGKYI